MNIRGVLVNYYFICKRAMWFESRRINYTNEYMEIGKLVHEKTYRKMKKREVIFAESVAIDIIKVSDGVEVYEVKKSSAALEAAIWQLRYYLYVLKKHGIRARGFVVIPKEKKKIAVTLENEKELLKILRNIERIIKNTKPPDRESIRFCKKCSYHDFCWV